MCIHYFMNTPSIKKQTNIHMSSTAPVKNNILTTCALLTHKDTVLLEDLLVVNLNKENISVWTIEQQTQTSE